MIEGIPEEVHVAAPEGGFGEDLADGGAHAGVVVGDHAFDPAEAAFAKIFPGETPCTSSRPA